MLKNKLEEKLYTKGQTIQSAQMMENHRTLRDKFSVQDTSKPKVNYLRNGIGAQPAIYDSNVMFEPDHAPLDMRSYDEIDEIEDRNREKLAEKLKDPLCTAKNLIFHYDYANDNHQAISVPQKKFLPEKTFWNIDMEKMQAETLVGNTRTIFRIADPTMYPLTTPMHLVPFTLPTQCNTLIGLYVLGQLFNDFDKTCKKRITPTGITEGERGFEQTKRCYLTEVMPFFKLLKEHFEGLKTTINDDVTNMKKVFKDVENEAKQLAIDLKYSEIDRKNTRIMNENLIANCIAQDVFYTVTDSALSAKQSHEISVTLNVFQNRVIELEGENLRLHTKIQNDDHDNMARNFSKLEVDNLSLQLQYQHLEESIKLSNAKTSSDAPEFETCFELSKKDDVIQAHSNTIRKLKAQIAQLKSNMGNVDNNSHLMSPDSHNVRNKTLLTVYNMKINGFVLRCQMLNNVTKSYLSLLK